jgi:predicted alpha/beta superfamily hydrolase
LYISFPKNYSAKDSISYSVLYVLDGKFCLPIIRATKIFIENDIEEFIIVGVNASNIAHRYEDYTTSVSTSEDEKEEKILIYLKVRLNLEEQLNFLNPLKQK